MEEFYRSKGFARDESESGEVLCFVRGDLMMFHPSFGGEVESGFVIEDMEIVDSSLAEAFHEYLHDVMDDTTDEDDTES